MPHVSVITASYNSISTIGKTIESVHCAVGEWDIQQIFVDGGSDDGTVDYIRNTMRANDVLISEKDDGIADAFNKGLKLATGKYVHILNSDDWADPKFWDIMLCASNGLQTPLMHSDLILVSKGIAYRNVSGSNDYAKYIDLSMSGIMHPSCLVQRKVFDKIGAFSTDIKYAMDLEWYQRAYDAGYVSEYVAGAVVHFATGTGQSFSDGGVVADSTMLAKKRGISKWRILKMQIGKKARLALHKYYVGFRLIGK